MRRQCYHYCLALLLAASATARGAELIDPTRPAGRQATTAPAATAAPVSSALRLQGIVFADDRRIAIINGKLLRAGDTLGDIRIQAIASDAVHYLRAGRSHTLRLVTPELQVRRSAAPREAKQ